MFESAELGNAVDKATYKREAPKLRQALLDAQMDTLTAAKYPVLVVIGGIDGAGKGETVNLLNEWMDPRHIQTHAFGAPTDEENERPFMWRYWRALPPKGRIGIFFHSWYSKPILDRVYGNIRAATLDRRMEEIVAFERMLADEGALILKFWFHLSKARQKERLRALEKDKSTRWRVSKLDWEHVAIYDKFKRVTERALRESSRECAPWTVVEGADTNFRTLTVGRALLSAMTIRLAAATAPAPTKAAATAAVAEAHVPARPAAPQNIARAIDLTRTLDKDEYEEDLIKWQGRLSRRFRAPDFGERAVVAVFEGSDAAGKGGAIRRVTGALDARQYRVVPIAAPTEEERAQPYLWRFWRHLPRRGHMTIFDRSWYGRVLVERVEGYCRPTDWLRAYGEINDFEEQMAQAGIVVVKFWLQISKEEQRRRFKEREEVAFKRFKITPDDWRNRAKWDEYEAAMCDMVDRTSTDLAPWTLVPAEDKNFARIMVLRTLVARLE